MSQKTVTIIFTADGTTLKLCWHLIYIYIYRFAMIRLTFLKGTKLVGGILDCYMHLIN